MTTTHPEEASRMHKDVYSAIMGGLFGPFDIVSDETDARIWRAVDAVITLLRDRLLSDEAVEAAMRAMDDHAFSSEEITARAALSAALDRIETHDR